MADTVEPAGTTEEEPKYSFLFSYTDLNVKKKHPPEGQESFSFVSRYTRNQSFLQSLVLRNTFTKSIEWKCEYGISDFWWSTFQIRIPIPGRMVITKSEWIPLPYPFYNANNANNEKYRDKTIEFKVEIYPEKKSSTDTTRDVIITKYNRIAPSINIEEKKYIFTLVGNLWKVTPKTGGKRKTTKRKNRKPIKLKPKSHKKRTPASWT